MSILQWHDHIRDSCKKTLKIRQGSKGVLLWQNWMGALHLDQRAAACERYSPPLYCHVCAGPWHGSTSSDHWSQSKEQDTAGWGRATQWQVAACVCLSLLSDGAASSSWLHLIGSPRNDPPPPPEAEIRVKRGYIHSRFRHLVKNLTNGSFLKMYLCLTRLNKGLTSVMLTTNKGLGGSLSGSMFPLTTPTGQTDWLWKSTFTLHSNST